MICRRVVFVLVVSMSLSSLGGCAVFRSGEFQPPASWPLSQGPGKQSISLLVTGEFLNHDSTPDIYLQTKQIWQEAATKAYTESGLFSDVKTGAAETDLRAEVHVLKRCIETPLREVTSFLMQLSLSLFPGIERCEFVLRTTLKNKEGQEAGTFEMKEKYSNADGLLLIFLLPFYWENKIYSEMFYDLNRATLSQVYGAGRLQARH